MPQFDFYSFSSQVFWSLFGFFVFYFFILRFYVTSFGELLKMRKKLIETSQNLLPNTTDNSLSAYDKAISSVIV
jgi:hypothetical protein